MKDDIRKWAEERAFSSGDIDCGNYKRALLDLAPLVEAAREVERTSRDPARIDPSVGVFLCEPSAESVIALAAALRELGVPGLE